MGKRIAINVCKDYLRSAWNRRVSVVEALNEIPAQKILPMKMTRSCGRS